MKSLNGHWRAHSKTPTPVQSVRQVMSALVTFSVLVCNSNLMFSSGNYPVSFLETYFICKLKLMVVHAWFKEQNWGIACFHGFQKGLIKWQLLIIEPCSGTGIVLYTSPLLPSVMFIITLWYKEWLRILFKVTWEVTQSQYSYPLFLPLPSF